MFGHHVRSKCEIGRTNPKFGRTMSDDRLLFPALSQEWWLLAPQSVDCLLRDCERYFPNTNQNIAENLIVRLQVTIDSVRGLLDSLDRCEAGNTARILVLESLVIQPRTLSRWELLAIVAASCTSICSIRGLATVSPRSRRPRV